MPQAQCSHCEDLLCPSWPRQIHLTLPPFGGLWETRDTHIPKRSSVFFFFYPPRSPKLCEQKLFKLSANLLRTWGQILQLCARIASKKGDTFESFPCITTFSVTQVCFMRSGEDHFLKGTTSHLAWEIHSLIQLKPTPYDWDFALTVSRAKQKCSKRQLNLDPRHCLLSPLYFKGLDQTWPKSSWGGGGIVTWGQIWNRPLPLALPQNV